MFDINQLDQQSKPQFVVLAKLTASRFNQDWHYHLANEAGRPRCGALLNLREWHERSMPDVPTGLCARCARSLGRTVTAPSIHIRIRDTDDDALSDQLALPLE